MGAKKQNSKGVRACKRNCGMCCRRDVGVDTDLVAGVIFAMRQQRELEEPAHDAHDSARGASAAAAAPLPASGASVEFLLRNVDISLVEWLL